MCRVKSSAGGRGIGEKKRSSAPGRRERQTVRLPLQHLKRRSKRTVLFCFFQREERGGSVGAGFTRSRAQPQQQQGLWVWVGSHMRDHISALKNTFCFVVFLSMRRFSPLNDCAGDDTTRGVPSMLVHLATLAAIDLTGRCSTAT